MRSFLHLLGWRFRFCQWYFAIILGALLFRIVVGETPYAWISVACGFVLSTCAALIVYKTDLAPATKHYLATRPVGWRPVFWSRCLAGSLLCLLGSIAVSFGPFGEYGPDPLFFFSLMFPLSMNVYFWSAGGIILSRSIRNGQLFGLLPFCLVLWLLWKYFFPLFDISTVLLPEQTQTFPVKTVQSFLFLNALGMLSPVFSMGFLGLLESSMYRRRLRIPAETLLFLGLTLGGVFLSFHVLSYSGRTSVYQLPTKESGRILGYRRSEEGLLFVAETRQDNNKLFRLDLNDTTARPVAVCIVGATWDSRQRLSVLSGMLGPGLMDPGAMWADAPAGATEGIPPLMGMMTGAAPEQATGALSNGPIDMQPFAEAARGMEQQKPDEQAVLDTNPYSYAQIEQDRILLFGYGGLELLAYDRDGSTETLCSATWKDHSLVQCKHLEQEAMAFCLQSYGLEDERPEYSWRVLNLRSGEFEETSERTLPVPPTTEIEIGDRRYRLDISPVSHIPERIVIEQRSSPSGTGRLGELPPLWSAVVDETMVAGFVRASTYWPHWELRLYEVSDPALPTYVTLEIPVQFQDPLTWSVRQLGFPGRGAARGYFEPFLSLRLTDPFLLLGGGYLACWHLHRIGFWDISDSSRPRSLGTASTSQVGSVFAHIPDQIGTNHLEPLWWLSGPTTPLQRDDGALGYVLNYRRIYWFEFPELTMRK